MSFSSVCLPLPAVLSVDQIRKPGSRLAKITLGPHTEVRILALYDQIRIRHEILSAPGTQRHHKGYIVSLPSLSQCVPNKGENCFRFDCTYFPNNTFFIAEQNGLRRIYRGAVAQTLFAFSSVLLSR